MSILVSYYPGAYGPTLLIAPQSTQELEAFERLLRDLADGNVGSRELESHLDCNLDSLSSITLRRTGMGSSTRLVRTEVGPGRTRFDWSNTADGWRDCASRVQRLRESNAAGHQYLSREGLDDALVELSFRELTVQPGPAES